MRTILANVTLWFFGFWAVASLCAMAVLLYRWAREEYWRWRFERAINRRYPEDLKPLIHLIRKAQK